MTKRLPMPHAAADTPTEAAAGPPADAETPAGMGRTGRYGKGLTHELVEALTGQLRSGQIRPGDKLPTESAIMQSFGVSRGVVREALSRLQAAGLVQTHHGVGTFALDAHSAEGQAEGRFHLESPAHAGLADMLEVLELRASLEPASAAMAAMRRSEDHLQAMRAALADFAAHLSAVGETVAPDFRFHFAIAQATGNRYFSELMHQLGLSVIPRTRVSSARLDESQRERHLQKVHQEHLDIYAAIERRDPDGARAAMHLHLINSRERQRAAQ
ncbi:MAG TPA: FadR/GntR family transcriptional regulator [Ideonella sp.]|nr:FadR/GntR family transcriptional regulator [Ideonella sp.]